MSPHDDKWGILELQNCILNMQNILTHFAKSMALTIA